MKNHGVKFRRNVFGFDTKCFRLPFAENWIQLSRCLTEGIRVHILKRFHPIFRGGGISLGMETDRT